MTGGQGCFAHPRSYAFLLVATLVGAYVGEPPTDVKPAQIARPSPPQSLAFSILKLLKSIPAIVAHAYWYLLVIMPFFYKLADYEKSCDACAAFAALHTECRA